MPDLESIVLRIPADGGDFKYHLAKLQRHDAEQLEQRVVSGKLDPRTLEMFGPPLNLSQTMRDLDTRDFRVLDYPSETPTVQ